MWFDVVDVVVYLSRTLAAGAGCGKKVARACLLPEREGLGERKAIW